ncbi:MAG: hypothetical protein GY839_18385 [candidate division Zixibacteria bacterium]|nr:hypothetical protein [candidate division Zixibacteria bacterium]
MSYRILLIIFAIISTAQTRAEQSSCVSCHMSSEMVSDTSIAVAFSADDIHAKAGFDCTDCHGGDPRLGFVESDPELAMDPAKGYKSASNRHQIPGLCSGCHSDIEFMKKYNPRLPADQFQLYKTSVHGKLLYNDKSDKVAVCTDCHGTHGILPSSDSRSKVYYNNIPYTCKECHSDTSYMKSFTQTGEPLPTDQFDKYSQSIHGIKVLEEGDKSAPACNSCHGNHGASPPNLSSVSAACGECHPNNQEFFNNSPHKEAWIEMELPECEQCHGNHLIMPVSDNMVGTEGDALCIECHDDDSPGLIAAAGMKTDIDSLKTVLAITESAINMAEKKGVESGQSKFDLGRSNDALIQIRSAVHTFDPDKIAEIGKPAIDNALNVKASVDNSLKDIKMRQYGLGASLIVIILIVLGLRKKIKEVDRKINLEN